MEMYSSGTKWDADDDGGWMPYKSRLALRTKHDTLIYSNKSLEAWVTKLTRRHRTQRMIAL